MPKISSHGPVEHRFSNGQFAKVLTIAEGADYAHILSEMGLQAPTPTLVVIGGASHMTAESQAKLVEFFNGPLATLSNLQNITVLDGGTDAGVIHMMGEARRQSQGEFDLVGVAPLKMVVLPDGDRSHVPENAVEPPVELEPHHTHFCLVPGDAWGCESHWLAELSSVLAGSCPSITLLINGGQISLKDLEFNLQLGRRVMVVAGSGRLADAVANTISGVDPAKDERIRFLVDSYYPDQISVFDLLRSSLDDLKTQLKRYFEQ